MTFVLLSGAIATGKTAAAIELAQALSGEHVRVRQALASVLGIAADDRGALQREGADLDRRTRGRWLRDYLEEHHTRTNVVVDALRTTLQTVPILDGAVDARLVFLEAHESTRRARYSLAAASDPVKASVDFDTAMHHPTEQNVTMLRAVADLVLETDDLDAAAIAGVIADAFGAIP